MAGYNRPEGGWTYSFDGLNVTDAPDHLNPTQYPLAINIRALADRSVRTRPGYTLYSTYPAVMVITAACPTAQPIVGIPYTYQLTVAGGEPPYTWAIITGALPTGLGLNPSTGLISGTPTTANTFAWTARVTDNLGNTATLSCSTTTVLDELRIAACPSESPTLFVAYSFTLEALGGEAPYTYAITAGALPTGLSLNPSTGEIAGTPTAGGHFDWTATVTDATTATAPIACSFDISADLIIRPTTYTENPVPSIYPTAPTTRVCLVVPHTNPATAFDGDDATYFTLLISGGTGVSTFAMEHFYNFAPVPADLTGLVSVTFHIRMRARVDGNSPNAVYGEVFDGINTSDTTHDPNPACVATCIAINGPISADWANYASLSISAAVWAGMTTPTVRIFPKSATGELGTPYPEFDWADVWAVMHFA